MQFLTSKYAVISRKSFWNEWERPSYTNPTSLQSQACWLCQLVQLHNSHSGQLVGTVNI